MRGGQSLPFLKRKEGGGKGRGEEDSSFSSNFENHSFGKKD